MILTEKDVSAKMTSNAMYEESNVHAINNEK